MSDNKKDFLTAVIALIIVTFIVSMSSLPPQDETTTNKNESTGSGTQIAGDDSSVILPSDGDTLTTPEEIEPEDTEPEPESPKTGYF